MILCVDRGGCALGDGHVDDDADSVVVVERDELEKESDDDGTAAAKAEDLLREIVNYGLEQGRHSLREMERYEPLYCAAELIFCQLSIEADLG